MRSHASEHRRPRRSSHATPFSVFARCSWGCNRAGEAGVAKRRATASPGATRSPKAVKRNRRTRRLQGHGSESVSSRISRVLWKEIIHEEVPDAHPQVACLAARPESRRHRCRRRRSIRLHGRQRIAAQQGAPAVLTNTQAGRRVRAFVKLDRVEIRRACRRSRSAD